MKRERSSETGIFLYEVFICASARFHVNLLMSHQNPPAHYEAILLTPHSAYVLITKVCMLIGRWGVLDGTWSSLMSEGVGPSAPFEREVRIVIPFSSSLSNRALELFIKILSFVY